MSTFSSCAGRSRPELAGCRIQTYRRRTNRRLFLGNRARSVGRKTSQGQLKRAPMTRHQETTAAASRRRRVPQARSQEDIPSRSSPARSPFRELMTIRAEYEQLRERVLPDCDRLRTVGSRPSVRNTSNSATRSSPSATGFETGSETVPRTTRSGVGGTRAAPFRFDGQSLRRRGPVPDLRRRPRSPAPRTRSLENEQTKHLAEIANSRRA